MKTGISVFDAMTTKPVMLEPNDSLKKCAQEMADKHVGAILIKENNHISGIITEQDIVRRVVSLGINPQRKKISDFMSKKLSTINPKKDIYDALMLMKDKNIRHVPVVDGKKILGLLTLKDILKIEPQLFDLIVEKIELREEENKPVYKPSGKEGICQECGEFAKELHEKGGVLVCEKCVKKY